MTEHKDIITQDEHAQLDRRNLLKGMAWSAPVVLAVSLPKHAQATNEQAINEEEVFQQTYFFEIIGDTPGVDTPGYWYRAYCIEVIGDMYTMTYRNRLYTVVVTNDGSGSGEVINDYNLIYTAPPASIGTPVTLTSGCSNVADLPEAASSLTFTVVTADINEAGIVPAGGSEPFMFPAGPCELKMEYLSEDDLTMEDCINP